MKKFHLFLKTFGMMLTVLMMSVSLASCGDDDDPEPVKPGDNQEQDGEYAGKNFVGTWEGSDGSDSFAIILGADGSYTDYLVINGERKFPETGKYTVSGSTLTVPSNSNLHTAWSGNTFTMSVSGSRMTLTNSLMNDWGQELVLTKK